MGDPSLPPVERRYWHDVDACRESPLQEFFGNLGCFGFSRACREDDYVSHAESRNLLVEHTNVTADKSGWCNISLPYQT